jgi:hypothetical protein
MSIIPSGFCSFAQVSPQGALHSHGIVVILEGPRAVFEVYVKLVKTIGGSNLTFFLSYQGFETDRPGP